MKKMISAAIGLILSTTALATYMPETYNKTIYAEDTTAVGISGDYAPGFGTGSIAANGVSKSELRIDINSIFNRNVFTNAIKINELASISFYTKKIGSDSNQTVDWYLEIYTKPDLVNDDSWWFGRRLTIEPYFSVPGGTAPADQWNQYSTDEDASNRLRVFDYFATNNYGRYTDPFLSDITCGNVSWNDYGYTTGITRNYSCEEIMYMNISTGSGWAAGYNGQVDGLVITLTSGDTAVVNFEVPEPATLGVLALGGLMAFRRRRV